MLNHFLLTFPLMKLFIFVQISSLKTLILLKVLQSQNLNSYYLWLQRTLTFIFNGLLYKQIDSVAMGLPLGPSLANAFLSYHEKNWLNNCLQGFKPVFYRLYVHDIFILFKLNDHLKYFQEFLNSCHINMSFSMETEKKKQIILS